MTIKKQKLATLFALGFLSAVVPTQAVVEQETPNRVHTLIEEISLAYTRWKNPLSPELEKLTNTLEWCKENPPRISPRSGFENGCRKIVRDDLIARLSTEVDEPKKPHHYDQAKTLLEKAVTLDVEYRKEKNVFKPQATSPHPKDIRLTSEQVKEVTLNKLGAPLSSELSAIASDLEWCKQNPPHSKPGNHAMGKKAYLAGCHKGARNLLKYKIDLIIADPKTPDLQHNQAEKLLKRVTKLDDRWGGFYYVQGWERVSIK